MATVESLQTSRKGACRGALLPTLLVVLWTLTLATTQRARAAEYEAEIDVDSDSELYDLFAEGTISEATLDTLLALLRSRVDLNGASRDELYVLPGLSYVDVESILEYRARVGVIRDPTDLARDEVLAPAEVSRLQPFWRARQKAKHPKDTSGRLQLQSRSMTGDHVAPPVRFSGRLQLPHGLAAGGSLVSTRLRLGKTRYASTHRALLTQPARYRLEVAKYFAQWKTAQHSVVVGTFRVGFAERLTLDNTRRVEPSGIYPDELVHQPTASTRWCRYSGADGGCTEQGRYVTPDFSFQPGFRGVAAGVTGLTLGPKARLSLHGFAAHTPRSVYQYEVYDRALCADPREASDRCAAPPVLEAPDGMRRYAFVTLPHVYDELAAGGNATLELGDASELGLTGYYAQPSWRIRGVSLDFQEWSRYPFGGGFGALGLSAATRSDSVRFFIEVARSFDRKAPRSGGFGVIQRSVYAAGNHELELSLRYYGASFDNPYARPISTPNELDGLSARNEIGVRLRYFASVTPALRLRSSVDVSLLPSDGRVPNSAGTARMDLSARADWKPLPRMELAGWFEHVNKDLRRNGRGLCYDVPAQERGPAVLSELRACHGELHQLTARVATQPLDAHLEVNLQYTHALVSDPRYARWFRQAASIMGELSSRPLPTLRLRARSRYVTRALGNDRYLERSLASFFDVTYGPGRLLEARARYARIAHLDARESTLTRRPNPEHVVQLELESRF